MVRGVFVLPALFALAACTDDLPTMKWSKPGVTYGEFVADRRICVQESRAQSKTYYLNGVRMSGNPDVLDPGVFLPCMHAHGYSPGATGYAAPPGEEMPVGP
jgi:hypothetical protein